MNDTAPTTLPATPFYAEAPNALSILLDDRLFRRCEVIADKMASAGGVTPLHLLNKPAACFAVVATSINWRLNPFAVARCTYQTPGGQIGYEGKLCQAILESSGKLEGPVTYEHFGDWTKVKGKYEIRRSEKSGKDFARVTWTRKDAEGLGVMVRAKVIGEVEPRELRFDLDDCFPLNSTLWATRPQQQICYTAVRAFANLAAPGLFMGVPFDRDETAFGTVIEGDDPAPPRPKRENFATAGHADLDAEYRETVGPTVDTQTGEITETQQSAAASQEAPAVDASAGEGGKAAALDPGTAAPAEAATAGAPEPGAEEIADDAFDSAGTHNLVLGYIAAATNADELKRWFQTDSFVKDLKQADATLYSDCVAAVNSKIKQLRSAK